MSTVQEGQAFTKPQSHSCQHQPAARPRCTRRPQARAMQPQTTPSPLAAPVCGRGHGCGRLQGLARQPEAMVDRLYLLALRPAQLVALGQSIIHLTLEQGVLACQWAKHQLLATGSRQELGQAAQVIRGGRRWQPVRWP